MRARVAALLHLLCGLPSTEVGMGAWEVAEVIVRHSEAARDDCRKTAAEIRWAEAEEAVDQEDHAFDKAVEYMLSDGGRPWKKVPGKYRARLAGKRDEVVAEVERLRKEEVSRVSRCHHPLW